MHKNRFLAPALSIANNTVPFSVAQSKQNKDFFIQKEGVHYAGTHLIIDLWKATNLDNINLIEQAFKEAIDEAGATLLHIHLHQFEPNGGISGVAVLAESHISVHTWPEKGYAAFDVFMCGDAKPYKVLPVLKRHFKPEHTHINEQLRGAKIL